MWQGVENKKLGKISKTVKACCVYVGVYRWQYQRNEPKLYTDNIKFLFCSCWTIEWIPTCKHWHIQHLLTRLMDTITSLFCEIHFKLLYHTTHTHSYTYGEQKSKLEMIRNICKSMHFGFQSTYIYVPLAYINCILKYSRKPQSSALRLSLLKWLYYSQQLTTYYASLAKQFHLLVSPLRTQKHTDKHSHINLILPKFSFVGIILACKNKNRYTNIVDIEKFALNPMNFGKLKAFPKLAFEANTLFICEIDTKCCVMKWFWLKTGKISSHQSPTSNELSCRCFYYCTHIH